MIKAIFSIILLSGLLPLSAGAMDNQPKEFAAVTENDPYKLFSGTFHYVETTSLFWHMQLAPKEKNVSLTLKGLYDDASYNGTVSDISNAIGYIGTDFREPEYWEMISFNLSRDGQSAMVELLLLFSENSELPPGAHCVIKLTLDDYNNLNVSFVRGNGCPWIILGDTPITFIRQ